MKPYIRTGLIATGIAVALMVAVSVICSTALPASGNIPVDWDINGQPTDWADRREALLQLSIVPMVTLIIGLILAVAPTLEPRRRNVERGRKAYLATWISVVILLLVLHAGVSLSMTGAIANTSHMVRWVIAGAAILFIVMGNYLPKTRSSFIFGVRTPWTLSSDEAWEKTHRLAGPLFMIAGFLGLIGAFIFNGLLLALQLTALVLTAAAISVVYSYFAWRNAADRDEGTGLTV